MGFVGGENTKHGYYYFSTRDMTCFIGVVWQGGGRDICDICDMGLS